MADLEENLVEAETQAKSVIMETLSDWKKVAGLVITLSSLLTAVWAVDDRFLKAEDLTTMEGRIVSEFRSESAKTRSTLIEDMESRLDEFDYDISIKEKNDEVVPEVLNIKRNMLYRRIEELKNNEIINNADSN